MLQLLRLLTWMSACRSHCQRWTSAAMVCTLCIDPVCLSVCLSVSIWTSVAMVCTVHVSVSVCILKYMLVYFTFLILYGFGMELVSEVTLCQNGMSLECEYSIDLD